MIAAALALALPVLAAEHHDYARVFAVGNKIAAVYDRDVEFYALPPDSLVTVSGKSAFGPLPATGQLLIAPDLKPAKVMTFETPIAEPMGLERNASRFLVCADFCGVLDVSGRVIYQAPRKAGRALDAMALSQDGRQAIFEYRDGKTVESYLVWTEGGKEPKTYKADVRDMELRRVLNRLGLNDWNPEPEKKPKPGAHNP